MTKKKDEHEESIEELLNTLGQQYASKVAKGLGSWTFIFLQTFFFIVWCVYNSLKCFHHFDEYPYTFLNLVLGFISAYTGPILLIAANHQDNKEKITTLKIIKLLESIQKNTSKSKNINIQ